MRRRWRASSRAKATPISAADRLGFVLREPIGVVSIITPWNFPLLIVSQKLPFALAAGCTCVVKPSEMTSASTLHLGVAARRGGPARRRLQHRHRLRAGGRRADDDAIRDVDMISFTGIDRRSGGRPWPRPRRR